MYLHLLKNRKLEEQLKQAEERPHCEHGLPLQQKNLKVPFLLPQDPSHTSFLEIPLYNNHPESSLLSVFFFFSFLVSSALLALFELSQVPAHFLFSFPELVFLSLQLFFSLKSSENPFTPGQPSPKSLFFQLFFSRSSRRSHNFFFFNLPCSLFLLHLPASTQPITYHNPSQNELKPRL